MPTVRRRLVSPHRPRLAGIATFAAVTLAATIPSHAGGALSSLVADVSGLGLWGAYTSGRAGGEVALIAEKGFTGLAGFMARGEVGYRSDGSAPYLRIGADLNYLFVGPYVGLTQTFDAYPSTAFSVGLSLSVPASLTKLPVSFAVRAFHESFLYNRAHAADGWVFGAGITWTFR